MHSGNPNGDFEARSRPLGRGLQLRPTPRSARGRARSRRRKSARSRGCKRPSDLETPQKDKKIKMPREAECPGRANANATSSSGTRSSPPCLPSSLWGKGGARGIGARPASFPRALPVPPRGTLCGRARGLGSEPCALLFDLCNSREQFVSSPLLAALAPLLAPGKKPCPRLPTR